VVRRPATEAGHRVEGRRRRVPERIQVKGAGSFAVSRSLTKARPSVSGSGRLSIQIGREHKPFVGVGDVAEGGEALLHATTVE